MKTPLRWQSCGPKPIRRKEVHHARENVTPDRGSGFVLTIAHAALLVVDAPLSDPGDTEVILQSIVDSSLWAKLIIVFYANCYSNAAGQARTMAYVRTHSWERMPALA